MEDVRAYAADHGIVLGPDAAPVSPDIVRSPEPGTGSSRVGVPPEDESALNRTSALVERINRLNFEVASLNRLLGELRAENRMLHSDLDRARRAIGELTRPAFVEPGTDP